MNTDLFIKSSKFEDTAIFVLYVTLHDRIYYIKLLNQYSQLNNESYLGKILTE